MLTTARLQPVTSLPKQPPEHTIGGEALNFTRLYIRQPDGPDAGGPWFFTPEQIDFVLWWYAIDENGRFLAHRGVLRRCKGWGKSPVMAALALFELCGNARFSHWDADGNAIARPVSASWVQLAGVSLIQTTNTMSMVLAMVNESPIVEDFGLDVGLTRIYSANGGRLEPITASAPTAEGARPTFVVQDETHWWSASNGGHKLDSVNRRNLGKSRDGAARMLESTNAHIPGEDSVAERSHDVWRAQVAGETRSTGLLYDTREAPPGIDLGDDVQLEAGLSCAIGDSHWLDKVRIRDEILDGATPPSEARRFYLNQLDAAVDSWLSEPEWGACLVRDRTVPDGTTITLGYDGSRSRVKGVTDATAFVACTLDGYLFEPLEISVWEQPTGAKGWEVPAAEVDASLHEIFRRYKVVGFYADPALWESYIAQWEARYVSQLRVKASRDHPISWWMTGARSAHTVRALEQFHSAVIDRELTHSDDFFLNRHVINARRNPSSSGLQIRKEASDSPRKIDAAVAAVLAWQARLDALAAGAAQPTKRFVMPRRLD